MNDMFWNLAVFGFVNLFIVLLFSFHPYMGRKAVLFGVFIPEGAREHTNVRRLRIRFSACVWAAAVLIFAAAAAVSYAWNDIMEASISASLVIQIGAFLLMYAGFRKLALQLKAEYGWKMPAAGMRVASLHFHRHRSTLGNGWYAVQFAIAVICAGFAALSWDRIPETIATHFNLNGQPDAYSVKSVGVVFFLNIMQLFLAGLFMFVNYSIRISKQQLDPADPEKSMEKQLHMRRASSLFLWVLSLVITIFLGMGQGFMLYGWPQQPMKTAFLALPFLLVANVIGFVVYMAAKGYDIPSDSTVHEDRYWRGGGLFYYNPDDSALFVAKRVGYGWTLNFAQPASWWIVAGILAAAAAILLLASLLT